MSSYPYCWRFYERVVITDDVCDLTMPLKLKMAVHKAVIGVMMYESVTWALGTRFSWQSGNKNVDSVDKGS